jgi:hypothetical protein
MVSSFHAFELESVKHVARASATNEPDFMLRALDYEITSAPRTIETEKLDAGETQARQPSGLCLNGCPAGVGPGKLCSLALLRLERAARVDHTVIWFQIRCVELATGTRV